MKKYLPYLILASCFLLLKLTTLGIRLSDTNIYFYTGTLLLQGKVLYKDIFFTNLPLFPYVSALYAFLTFKSLPLYYFTAPIEAVATGFLIYHIVLKQAKSPMLSALCSTLYLFSFMLLSTTDHQTGVFLASLFAVLSYYFYLEKKLLFTGIFIALALLTKAYFLPIFLTYLVVSFLRNNRGGESEKKAVISRSETTRNPQKISHFVRNDNILFFFGFFATIFITLLPTLIFAPNDFFRDVFEYSLTRSQGLNKMTILWFYITHDLLVFASLLYSLVILRKHLFFGVLSIFSILFYFLYKDIYYLYLNFLLPFLCINFAYLYQDLQKRMSMQAMVLPTIVSIFLFVNLFIYLTGYRSLQKIDDIELLTSAINNTKPLSLYGANGITPALAYLTDTPLLNKTIDTNPNLFRKRFLNAESLTKDALTQKAMFVTEGIYYPEMGVNQPITDEVIDIKQLQRRKCSLVQSVPIKTEGYQNRINLITCE